MKEFIKNTVPPFILKSYRRATSYFSPKSKQQITFRESHKNWESSLKDVEGYDVEAIFERVAASTQMVWDNEAAYERDGVIFDEIEYPWPIIGLLLNQAMKSKGELKVLDFGGALGSTYNTIKHFLSEIPTLTWTVVEQPHFVEYGNAHSPDEHLNFCADLKSALKLTKPNVILVSSTMQYIRTVENLIETINSSNADLLIIDRTPVHSGTADLLTIQEVPPSLVKASYLCWILSESKLLATLQPSWQLEVCFDSFDLNQPTDRGTEIMWKGYALSRKRNRLG